MSERVMGGVGIGVRRVMKGVMRGVMERVMERLRVGIGVKMCWL